MYHLLEKNAMVKIALRAGKVECFCNTDATKGQEISFEDFA